MVRAQRIRHEQCPRCRAVGRDTRANNMAVYPDNHRYCFACGYTMAAPQLTQLDTELKRLRGIVSPTKSETYDLPSDVDLDFTVDALTWLKQYDITEAEILEHNICFSLSKNWLIFPYYNNVIGEDEELIAWQARSFADDDSRWKSFGPIGDVIYLINDTMASSKIVIVEDILSAIKVGRIHTAVPLFGSDRPKLEKMIQRLSRSWHELIFWLDKDAQDRAVWAAMQCAVYSCRGFAVMTEQDPKVYGVDEIKSHLQFIFDRKNGR